MTSGAGDPVVTDASPPAGVTVEAVSWVTRFTGGDGTSRVLIDEPLQAGDTPQTVLRRVGHRYPKLNELLWTAGDGAISEHVQVMLDNVLVGPEEIARHHLSAGTTITLLGQYMGG